MYNITVSPELAYFDNESKIDRLLRELRQLDVPVIGGATVGHTDGHWTIGCHQVHKMQFGYKSFSKGIKTERHM